MRARLTYVRFEALILFSAFSLLASLASASRIEAAEPRPNIVFILTDDMADAEAAFMPKLKSLLIDQGMTFENHLINVSLCCPSRATILLGQYAHNTGILTNAGPNGGFETAYRLGIEKRMVGNWLQAGGYRTAHFGKYLNGYPIGATPAYVPPGWDDWHSAIRGRPYSEFNYALNENGKSVTYGSDAKSYGTDVYAAKANAFIRKSAADGKPFFIQLAVYAPHDPATPAPRHAGLFPDARAPRPPSFNEEDVSDKPRHIRNRPPLGPAEIKAIDGIYRRRLQSLQAVDDGIGSIIETLKDTKQLDHTFIFFMSDNGYHLGQHRMPAGKITAYEEDIRVPLVIRGPNIPAGSKREHMTGNIDLTPTFAELAGASSPANIDGRSLVPLFAKEPPPNATWRRIFLLEHWPTPPDVPLPELVDEPADLDQRGRRNHPAGSTRLAVAPQARKQPQNFELERVGVPEFQGLRTRDHTYVEYVTGEKELYDNRRDPHQLENLATKAEVSLLKEMAERLNEMRKCAGASCRAAEDKPLKASQADASGG